jgi:3-deoxy-D-manno-octulosonic-acid transferase
MALSPQLKAKLSRLTGRAVARLIKTVHATSKCIFDPPDAKSKLAKQNPAIIAVWHGQFMMLASERPHDVKYAAMVARHGDAELIAESLSRLGVELVRGAGAGTRQRDRGGAYALRASLKALGDGMSFVMTADVPPGPARRAGEGIVTLARLSGRPIVPVAVASSNYKSLNTWSRMTINLPCSRLAYVVGDPISVPREASAAVLEAKRLEVEEALNAVTARAYELAGADPSRATPPTNDINAPPAPPGRALKLYRVATSLLRPAAPILLKIRERAGKEDPKRRQERLGIASAARPDGALIWLHAASVGETNAVLPLIERLRDVRPDLKFLLTTGTVTSASIAMRRLPAGAIHQYVPLDTLEFAKAFLDHWRPDLVVFTESEIWPNLILETAARGIPLTLISARMSNRSFGRWRRRPGMSKPLFNRFALVVTQNEKLTRRFGELGARNAVTAGNIKIDAPPPRADEAELEKLRTALGGRPVFLAASTHDGEEAIIAEAHRQVRRELGGLCTIIVPRHPDRGVAIATQLKESGLKVERRAAGGMPNAATDIYIADTLGELGTFYALAGLAFIGGSLVPKGGQNPIEAVQHGAAVLTGPHWYNFRDSYRSLFRHKGAVEVKGAGDLAERVTALLKKEEDLAHMRHGATVALQTLSGALGRTVDVLLAYLPPNEGLRRAS